MDDLAPHRALIASERLTRSLGQYGVLRRACADLLPQTVEQFRQTVLGDFADLSALLAPLRGNDGPDRDPLVTPAVSDLTDELRAIIAKSEARVS